MIDPQCRTLQHPQPLHPWQLHCAVLQNVLHAALLDKLCHNAQIGSLHAGPNEKHNVWMVELREEGHLRTKLQHAPLVELLLDEPLHGNIDALPLALVDHPIAAQAHLLAQLDL